MAGLFYLPRLMVYHVDAAPRSVQSETFKIMERRLLGVIMNPAMVASWVLGLMLAWIGELWTAPWFLSKLILVATMTWFHFWLARRCAAELRELPSTRGAAGELASEHAGAGAGAGARSSGRAAAARRKRRRRRRFRTERRCRARSRRAAPVLGESRRRSERASVVAAGQGAQRAGTDGPRASSFSRFCAARRGQRRSRRFSRHQPPPKRE